MARKKNFKFVYRTYLAKFRQDAGYSQVRLAKAINMLPCEYNLIENGKKGGLMNSRLIVKLVEALGVEVKDFVYAEKAYLDEVDRVNGIERDD